MKLFKLIQLSYYLGKAQRMSKRFVIWEPLTFNEQLERDQLQTKIINLQHELHLVASWNPLLKAQFSRIAMEPKWRENKLSRKLFRIREI
jgi:hypothetical protein